MVAAKPGKNTTKKKKNLFSFSKAVKSLRNRGELPIAVRKSSGKKGRWKPKLSEKQKAQIKKSKLIADAKDKQNIKKLAKKIYVDNRSPSLNIPQTSSEKKMSRGQRQREKRRLLKNSNLT